MRNVFLLIFFSINCITSSRVKKKLKLNATLCRLSFLVSYELINLKPLKFRYELSKKLLRELRTEAIKDFSRLLIKLIKSLTSSLAL